MGHLGAALVATRLTRARLGMLVGAAFALDLLWPVFLAVGLEAVRVDPGNTPFTPLDFVHYPWSHSLSMAIVWGVVIGRASAAALRDARAGLVIGLLVVSHWVLDFVTHRPDLPIWPGAMRVGLGLWTSIPLTLLVEGSLLAAGVIVYLRGTRSGASVRRWAFWSLVALTSILWLAGPWSPPPPSPGAVIVVGFCLWLLPWWGSWIDRRL